MDARASHGLDHFVLGASVVECEAAWGSKTQPRHGPTESRASNALTKAVEVASDERDLKVGSPSSDRTTAGVYVPSAARQKVAPGSCCTARPPLTSGAAKPLNFVQPLRATPVTEPRFCRRIQFLAEFSRERGLRDARSAALRGTAAPESADSLRGRAEVDRPGCAGTAADDCCSTGDGPLTPTLMFEAAKHVLVIVGVAWVFVITLLVFLYAAGWRFPDD